MHRLTIIGTYDNGRQGDPRRPQAAELFTSQPLGPIAHRQCDLNGRAMSKWSLSGCVGSTRLCDVDIVSNSRQAEDTYVSQLRHVTGNSLP